MKKALLMCVLIAGLVPRTWADKHPVALGPKPDEATCVQCHQGKSKGKTVHPAVAMGCFTCHVVRQAGDTTRITLKNGRAATLCFSCHSDKQPSKIQGHVHPPAQSDCLKCHDPHTSDNEHLLVKAASGPANENLCLSCHTQGTNVPKGGSRHAALDMGCTTCHSPHKAGERGQQEFDFHLSKATPALCLDCHDAKDKDLQAAHNNQPFGSADCVQCHNPHQSASPKLLQANLHPPFEAKACDTCHQPAKDGNVVLTQSDGKALCVTCHDETAKKIEAAKVQHPGAQGDCTVCHDPHAGKSARFLKPNPVSACTTCHTDKAEEMAKKPVLHDPVFNQKCSICHEAHGGERAGLLRDDVNALCLNCHGPDAKALVANDGSSEGILGNTVQLPAGYVSRAPHLELTNGAGHPVPGHPLSAADPRDPAKKITCISCHDPHAGVQKKRLLSANGSIRAMCAECHQPQAKEQSK